MTTTTKHVAQRIASDWHGGQSSALYSFASTGTVTEWTLIEAEREHKDNPDDDDLAALVQYLTHTHGDVDADWTHDEDTWTYDEAE